VKVAILAGGLGSRIDPSGSGPPKALVTIGGEPILWHLLRYYAHFGVTDSLIALGHKGDQIRAYFESRARRRLHQENGFEEIALPCGGGAKNELVVGLADTGETTGTGGRIERLVQYIGNTSFMLTWCDGLSNVDLNALVAFHGRHGRLATVTAVHPPSSFGHLFLEGDRVARFEEKPEDRLSWINGGFFVLEPGIRDYLSGDETIWERGPMQRLAEDGELMAFRHTGFWQCMDTPMQNLYLEGLWADGTAPWKVWE